MLIAQAELRETRTRQRTRPNYAYINDPGSGEVCTLVGATRLHLTSCSRRTEMSTNRRKMTKTKTLDTEDLEDPVAGQSLRGHDGLPAPLRHRRRMANVLFQMTGPNGAGSAAPRDLARQPQPRMLHLPQNRRGRRQTKVASADTRTVILRRVLAPPRILPLP